jgi:hypothetical protein
MAMYRSTYFRDERIAWIRETLRVFGGIRVIHLQRKFDVSAAQASIDLRTFREEHPKTIRKEGRGYVASRGPE